jgi:hypothetical protein
LGRYCIIFPIFWDEEKLRQTTAVILGAPVSRQLFLLQSCRDLRTLSGQSGSKLPHSKKPGIASGAGATIFAIHDSSFSICDSGGMINGKSQMTNCFSERLWQASLIPGDISHIYHMDAGGPVWVERSLLPAAFAKTPQRGMEPPLASFENHAHLSRFQLEGAGDGLRGLSMVVSLREDPSLELGPLVEGFIDFLHQSFTFGFCSCGPHL